MLAGAVGALVRFLLQERFVGQFPYGTIIGNLGAAFAVGVLAGADANAQLIAGVGFLGALSTWSGLANEVASYSRHAQIKVALLYLWLSAAAGVSLAWIGLQIGKTIG